MAQAFVPASPIPVVQHLYRVDPLQTSRLQRHSQPSRRNRRASFNSYHIARPQHDYLNSLFRQQNQDKHPSSQQHNGGDKQTFVYPPTSPTSPASPRSCVHSFSTTNMSIVEIVHNEPLSSSPPDLTESKSSKSSGSFRSSCLSDANGQENLSHFEDIALADSGRESDDMQSLDVGRKRLTGPQYRRASGTIYTRKDVLQSADALRDSTNSNTKTSRYPSLKGHVNGVLEQQQLQKPMPNGRPIRRGFTSPSAISFGAMSARDASSSRSPSPNARLSSNGSRSPRSSGGFPPNSFANNHRKYTRRSSLQPRKTIKELEDEYHDSDEEVPDDAVIWNVPISPRPPFGPSAPVSPKVSSSQARLTADLPVKVASEPSAAIAITPRSPKRPNMPHSATIGAFPHHSLALKGRRKSWTQDLSDEARELTAALEAHAEEVRESSDRRLSPSSSPPRSSLNDKPRAKPIMMELPAVQTGNIMIDPLPISKEKEAVLSRTRPSWLPPKSRTEEKKHIREWERMMAKAAEAEKRREQKQLEEDKGRKEMDYSLGKIWEQHVLPNWDVVVREPRTRELWWRGINPKSRGVVWTRAVGNELSLTEASYTAALGRAKAIKATIAELPSEEQQKHKDAAWLSAIARDVPGVLPELGLFGKESPLHDALEDVLLAYAAYRSDVGYVYGTHTLAGMLVLNLPPAEAFVSLANLLNRPTALAFLVNDHAAIHRTQDMVLATLKYKIPKLHDHLMDPKTGVTPDEWLSPFLMTMGTMHLAIESCSRVWDVAVFEGDKALVRAVVGVLSLLESRLYSDRDEILSLLGWGAKIWSFGDEQVMAAVREAGKVSPGGAEKK